MRIIRDNPQFVKMNSLQVIGLTKKRDKRSSVRFVKDESMPFRFFTAEKDIYDKFQRIDAIPLTLVFDSAGKLLDEEYGKQDLEDLALMLED